MGDGYDIFYWTHWISLFLLFLFFFQPSLAGAFVSFSVWVIDGLKEKSGKRKIQSW